MTDKQQINEFDIAIRNIVKNNFVKVPHYGKYGGYLCDIDISTSSIAEALYNAGYRKIDENAVVLTREEYDDLIEEITNVRAELMEVDLQRINARKETAKEILQLIRKEFAHFKYKFNISKRAKWIAVEDLYKQVDWLVHILPNAILDKLAKQFGVEVQDE